MSTQAAIYDDFVANEGRYRRLGGLLTQLLTLEVPQTGGSPIFMIQTRLKGRERLLGKAMARGATVANYKDLLGDVLGIRVICLTAGDVSLVEATLSVLGQRGSFRFPMGREYKRSFLRSSEATPDFLATCDLQDTGYAAIHYQVGVGPACAEQELADLTAELQLLTILEFAWAEIDHRYRYERVREGGVVPGYMAEAFRALGGHLQVLDRQVNELASASAGGSDGFTQLRELQGLRALAQARCACKFSLDAIHDVARQLIGHRANRSLESAFGELVSEASVRSFRTEFSRAMGRTPFSRPQACDQDLRELVEYSINFARGGSVADVAGRLRML